MTKKFTGRVRGGNLTISSRLLAIFFVFQVKSTKFVTFKSTFFLFKCLLKQGIENSCFWLGCRSHYILIWISHTPLILRLLLFKIKILRCKVWLRTPHIFNIFALNWCKSELKICLLILKTDSKGLFWHILSLLLRFLHKFILIIFC